MKYLKLGQILTNLLTLATIFLVKAKEFYYLLTKISTDIDYRLKLMASRLVIVLQSLFLLTFALLTIVFD